MAKPKAHLRVVRPGPFGGTLTTSLCGRLRKLSDGMNITDHPAEVTCAFCRAKLDRKAKQAHIATTRTPSAS